MTGVLNDIAIHSIIKTFPKDFHVSYENIIGYNTSNNIFNYNVAIALPEGKKCFVYFTVFQNQNVCFLFLLGDGDGNREGKEIIDVSFITLSFSHTLVYGTILYGTYFNLNGKKYITIEDIMYYKGKNVSYCGFNEKLKLFSILFSNDISTEIFNHKNFIMIRLCIMNANVSKLLEQIADLPYKIKFINYRFFSSSKKSLHIHYKPKYKSMDSSCIPSPISLNPSPIPSTPHPFSSLKKKEEDCLVIKPKELPNQKKYSENSMLKSFYNDINKYEQPKSGIFIVKATVKDDIYNLFRLDDLKQENAYGVAYIPTYKLSVMMNSIFRNIKENNNLDLLEESDDEEDFENKNPNKYVFLDKIVKMKCIYNSKFKKWTPEKIV